MDTDGFLHLGVSVPLVIRAGAMEPRMHTRMDTDGFLYLCFICVYLWLKFLLFMNGVLA